MHDWSDDKVDWKGINDCTNILYKYATKIGRIGGQIKEKFGTIRFYANFGGLSISTLLYPGYYNIPLPSWLYSLDLYYIAPVMRFFLGRLFFMWQKYWYNKAYQKCMEKYPHLRAEILSSADFIEFVKGASRKEEDADEERTLILGWNGETINTWIRKKDHVSDVP